jgi:DNA helicase-2/ATP-dependent DNA helicase PcrA
MTDALLHNLNPEQHAAVSAPPEHMLILAGAGSGKTRVLVHRMAWLAQNNGVGLHQMLAVTFTNKAAREIKHRIETLLNVPSHGLWLGTFHGIAHRLLRMHYQEAGLSEHFQVMDSDDQSRLIKRMLKDQNLDDKYYSPDKIQHFINQNKEQGLRSHQLKFNPHDLYRRTLQEMYQLYEHICKKNEVIDFAELLLASFELIQNNPILKQQYQERFKHILVDEFQDTNTIQYAWLKQLIGPDNKLLVVGDDDQSIYGWRGAKIENIHKVQKDFPGIMIRLEQNYRSTQTILNAANSLIANNDSRLGKSLWSKGEQGTPIQLYQAFNEVDEANFVVAKIQDLLDDHYKADEIAILYRANAQSRVLEAALLQRQIPYRVYGGLRFFDRAEIKNALAYARLTINQSDDMAFERVINFPARGIGEKTLSQIREDAKLHQRSLWQSLSVLNQTQQLPARAALNLAQFQALIGDLRHEVKDLIAPHQLEKILEASGLIPFYQAEPDEKNQGRVDNLRELINAVEEFYQNQEKQGHTPSLSEFLTHATLESSTDQTLVGDAIQLMTLHSAKGLEFPAVFLVGMEEELFPGRACQEDPVRLEEERRLCYVGMTRAMKMLYISYAEYRRLYGETKPHTPSRFLIEIPKTCIEPIRQSAPIKRFRFAEPFTPTRVQAAPSHSWKLGMNVAHAKFGEGIILGVEGEGDQLRLHIKFREQGSKWILADFIQDPAK